VNEYRCISADAKVHGDVSVFDFAVGEVHKNAKVAETCKIGKSAQVLRLIPTEAA
jgi:hypothetical protein